MKKTITALSFMLALCPYAVAQSTAADASLAAGTEANGKSGQKSLRAKKAPSEKQKAQHARMSACNKQAASRKLRGDERRKFVGTCMKG